MVEAALGSGLDVAGEKWGRNQMLMTPPLPGDRTGVLAECGGFDKPFRITLIFHPISGAKFTLPLAVRAVGQSHSFWDGPQQWSTWGSARLYLRSMSDLEARQIAGAETASFVTKFRVFHRTAGRWPSGRAQ